MKDGGAHRASGSHADSESQTFRLKLNREALDGFRGGRPRVGRNDGCPMPDDREILALRDRSSGIGHLPISLTPESIKSQPGLKRAIRAEDKGRRTKDKKSERPGRDEWPSNPAYFPAPLVLSFAFCPSISPFLSRTACQCVGTESNRHSPRAPGLRPGRLSTCLADASRLPPPGVEPGLRPSQSRVLIHHTSGSFGEESPARESNPAGRLRRPPCVRHTRRETLPSLLLMPPPGVEPGLRPSEGRVPSATLRGRIRDLSFIFLR